MKTNIAPLFAGILLLIIPHVQGQNVQDTSQVQKLDEIVVTGTKTEVRRSNIPLTVSVITRDNIEQSSESALMPVLSEQVPGLFVTQRGVTGFGVATGAAGQISMRGIGGNPTTEVLVLLNGNPQFMGIMGHPLPDAYVASDVERVEVIRGPGSALYGTNAMGGVINIITREQKMEGYSVHSQVLYGSFNTMKVMANGGFRKKGFDVFTSFNMDRTDGHRDSSGFSIQNGYLRMGYRFNNHLKLNTDFDLAHFTATDPGMEGTHAGNFIDIVRGMGSISLANQYDKSDGSLRLFYNFGDHVISDGFHSADANFGTILFQSFRPFRGNTITVGTDLKQYGGKAENTLAMGGKGVQLGDTTETEMAGYVEIQQQFWNRLTVNGAFRLEHNSVYGFEPIPSVGLAMRATSATVLKVSVSKGFRSPTIRELYLFAPANEHLLPERMMNYEASILQDLAGGKIFLELTFFTANGENLIQTVMGSNGPINQNSGRFSNTGLEFSGKYNTSGPLSGFVSYSYINTREPVLATPRQHLTISGTARKNRWNLNLTLEHVQDLLTRIAPEPISKNSYTLLNARIAYQLPGHFEFFVKGENLFNEKYYINDGYPMPGVMAMAGVSFRLNKAFRPRHP